MSKTNTLAKVNKRVKLQEKLYAFKAHVKFEEKNSKKPFILNEAIKVEKNNTILDAKQTIFICLKDKKEIPIIQTREPININELEKKASDIACFLQIPIKGI